jgi:alpha-amylase/alpha-mannosidase (GH57 family)
MATVSFLWHLHQPAYRTADGVAHAPWVILHAGGSYMTLAKAIADQGGPGQVLNIVPTLIEQLEAYHEGKVHDPVVESLVQPASDLGGSERRTLLEWAFHITPRQLERFVRLRELKSRRAAAADRTRPDALFGTGDLRDLQVLFILAQAGEQAWRDERLAELFAKGRYFDSEDHEIAVQWLLAQPGELLAQWRAFATTPEVEIATSPYAHPIVPLLIDTGVVRESWSPHPPPVVPELRHPDDARWQLATALAFMNDRGYRIKGCWPPEGSVSEDAVAIYGEAGMQWLVTDEGILERSLGIGLRHGDSTARELYQPWRLGNGGPTLLFRDRWLSDKIGFAYGHWDDETRAASALVSHLEGLAHQLPDEATIVVALDGENPWLHYANAGGPFLRELMRRLGDCDGRLRPTTLGEVVAGAEARPLERLHPGSWINSVFATWIGHPEKTRAWEVLAAVRDALPETELPYSLLLAEGSDWFWWLGDDNPTSLAPLYDAIYRQHLADVCAAASIEPPVDLDQPLKTVTMPVRIPVSSQWPPPKLDGKVTTYFEWSLATWISARAEHPLERVALWASPDTLHVLVETAEPLRHLINGDRLVIRLQGPQGPSLDVTVGAGGSAPDSARVGLGRVAELSLPWSAGPGYRLMIGLGPHQLPQGAALLLEPLYVDEVQTQDKDP